MKFSPASSVLLAALCAASPAWGGPAQAPATQAPATASAWEKLLGQKKYAEALPLLKKEADAGDQDAQVALAELHEKGQGTPRDAAQAVAWYGQAAKQGNPFAKYKLACDLPKREADWKAKCQAAEAGDAAAMRELGDLSFYGVQNTGQDEKVAADWYQKAAAKGDAQAMCDLGLMCEFGFGLKQDDKAAADWYAKADAAGCAEAAYRLGGLCEMGDGVEKDDAKALALYRKSAEAGCLQGMDMMAVVFSKGLLGQAKDKREENEWRRKGDEAGRIRSPVGFSINGVDPLQGMPQEHAAAVAWCQERAKSGNAQAMAMLGYWCFMGEPGPNGKDIPQARVWCTKAAKRGYEGILNILAYLCFNGDDAPKDDKVSYILWTSSTRRRTGRPMDKDPHMHAMWHLGSLFEGKSAIPADEDRMMQCLLQAPKSAFPAGIAYVPGDGVLDETDWPWCARLAHMGDPLARLDWGCAQINGNGVPRDEKSGWAKLEKAADGDAFAALKLGEMLCLGQDLPRDDAKGAFWLERAANAGNLRAMRLLGMAYHHGEGVPKDDKRAEAWYAKAASGSFYAGQDAWAYARETIPLTEVYTEGQDAPRDIAKAMKVWTPIPYGQGLPKARIPHRGIGAPKDLEQAWRFYADATNLGFGVDGMARFCLWEMLCKRQHGIPQGEWPYDLRSVGHIDAPLSLHDSAVCRLRGLHGTQRDLGKAMDEFFAAVCAGNDAAGGNLRLMFNDDLGDPKEKSEVRDALFRKAEAGDKDAMLRLGGMYLTGQGAVVDREHAWRWCSRAAAAGGAGAWRALGCMRANDALYRHWVFPRWEPARACFQKAADAGVADAWFCLGRTFQPNDRAFHKDRLPVDDEKAVACFAKGAAAGDAWSMLAIAELARRGDAAPKDLEKARRWYAAAAGKGNLLAMVVLADAYRAGEWVDKDPAQAFAWYEKAAAKGDAESMFRLARQCKAGDGVEKDEAKACAWYEKAAKLGHSGAMRNLGIALRDGAGVAADAKQAWTWLELAARDQAPNAGKYRDDLGASLPEADLKAAKAAADALAKTVWPDR